MIWITSDLYWQVELDQNFVDGARSTLTYDYARRSETMAMAVSTRVLWIDEANILFRLPRHMSMKF